MTFIEWVAIVAALCISLVAPYAIKPFLQRLRVIDVPNHRSSHTSPVLRGVGLAPMLGVLGGVGILVGLGPEGGKQQLLIVLLTSGAVSFVGVLEDLKGVRIAVRAGTQLLIGAFATSALAAASGSDWWWVPIGAIAFAGYTNVANFMDGINAISSLHGVAVGLAFVAISVMTDIRWLLPAGLVLAASFAAFLPWNLMRNRVFLGDVGSYLLGGTIAVIVIAAVLQGAPLVAMVAPLSIYLVDTCATLLRRILRGDDWQRAHRSHVYQRLTDTGLSHLSVALIVTCATFVTSALGLLALAESGSLLAFLAIAASSAAYLALPRLRGWGAPSFTPPTATFPSAISTRPLAISARGRWAVVGASGFIGKALAKELRAQGCDVVDVIAPRLFLDSAATADEVLEGLEFSSEAVNSMATALAGADVVVNAAGLALPGSAASASLSGANALLPLVVLRAAEQAHATRVVHLSSAAVQGRRQMLDESVDTSPFSPYSQSKALGESALLAYVAKVADIQTLDLVIVRATSVQGLGRATTRQLRRLARSPLASVARPGDAPTVVSSLRGLVEFVARVGAYPGTVPGIVLQPWEGMTTSSVLESAGTRPPVAVPAAVCRSLVTLGYAIGHVLPPVNGLVRRVELMWLGQEQDAQWARTVGLEQNSYVADVLAGAPERSS
ncbi:UDP-N-acetylmuramyl pentapeptide phosphotransferase/UDP-N-acetylglucosamine-1-phosphate transferase [Cryobacterium psychrotolerans]|uniref:UDP-N-acetylmuramyl pentapeptide phosphotransferase/UDP-N-acetylglucosamine-1-phosphate transferase n=1 Tax=Cryobacterium psychrotolerans TaxID=386301 RepID=A0A1G9BUW2_9MICO|nr:MULTISPECIES: NAD-dependent epimerase/dehydratase family protein [Cryobacterium]TFD42954.1 NAD-dependent epimerase/dehydratase family protein [Cryobacterium sp. TMT1-2-1]TFD84087.1 NAD-dependent epimerase/dehydratase family protein [Cryobacterium psychrotolerans]SDK42934.1 UDP-N-acetylmuramyl pentapeptide phosphotransferase/UDP-N-acetylglucosamine-1-phosphate transferase [Cryobacterium psychrotolerans]